jgi:hypothetical protein
MYIVCMYSILSIIVIAMHRDNGPSSQTYVIYIKFCQLLDLCKNILHPGITLHGSISKEDHELFCCETFKCDFNMNKINKPMSVVSRFISQLGDIRIRIRIRILYRVSGSLRVLRLPPPLKMVAMIVLYSLQTF